MREPPFRLFAQKLLKLAPTSVRTKADWDLTARPHYLVGVLEAALQAQSQGIESICVAEFGVAGGNGLIALESCAQLVAAETGVKIGVVGFDCGDGLPALCGDHRDHPDYWMASDYRMDVQALKSVLNASTELILGNVAETVPRFLSADRVPVGFASIDVDLYSSTRDALRILSSPDRRILRRTFLYMDDVAFIFSHRFAGELLAIDEFNHDNEAVKIDGWRSLQRGRIFHESPWIQRMYIAHDLQAISAMKLERASLDYLSFQEPQRAR